jgi:hypothetical protein
MTIDESAVARFHELRAQVDKARNRYYKLWNQVMGVVKQYSEGDERNATISRLRREIRLATRGAPQRHAHDEENTANYVSSGTEQLYNASSELLVDAYRKVRSLVHPDKGGDPELFHLVKTAYLLRDVTFLIETRLLIEHGSDPEWQQTEGIAWMEQELQRPAVSEAMLQTTIEFQIARAHRLGQVEQAQALANLRLAEMVVNLQSELNYLLYGSMKW